MIVVDTSVLLDVLTGDAHWAELSQAALDEASAQDDLVINPIIYAELSAYYLTIDDLESVIAELPLKYFEMPRSALFLAAKAFQRYRRRGGTKVNVLPDFFIGAHAAAERASLLTRDPSRVRAYFPTVGLINP
ncbi:MAG TPA: type II toxin-antitoxin system VapC family toxin [Rhizomicrobium sp.]|nr:type II toxin-antitoxin system VapC family toxin [Rhizomicrobium sp.]